MLLLWLLKGGMINQRQIKKVILKLHRQFNHIEKLRMLLNDAAINDIQTFQILAEISETCEICSKSRHSHS